MIPWYYRFGPTNWLMAKPWKWRMKDWQAVYRAQRTPCRSFAGHGRLRSFWYTITFPHVHHPSEDGE